ncbi:hypothetical protein LguiB_034892 [Lonicera macranthoides]
MGIIAISKSSLKLATKFTNDVISFIIFSVLDILDFLLCYTYKIADFLIENELKPCYCSSAKQALARSGKILVTEKGEYSKVVTLDIGSSKLQLEEVSDTLYTRCSMASDVSKFAVGEIKRLKMEKFSGEKKKGGGGSTLRFDSTIVKMVQGKKANNNYVVRWSDCDCSTCNSWSSSSCKDKLFVKAEGPKVNVEEDVLFIHGFISSSAFWTETLFPCFSKSTKSKYRLFAFDLLGFGRSPKPSHSLYTIREHLEMIESSIIEPYKVKSFHVVAHSLGCILALALALKHPGSVKSITLVAPPYFPAPKGEQATQYMMRKIAPRRVWPVIAFGASIACWYEHISRTICLLICKNHQLWEFLIKFITRNRLKTYLIEGFFCHTHNAAWHTLHNIICGTAAQMKSYLDAVNRLNCEVNIFHGGDDELIPVECSYDVNRRIPRAHVNVIDRVDHITIVVNRQKAFAKQLEEIWKK